MAVDDGEQRGQRDPRDRDEERNEGAAPLRHLDLLCVLPPPEPTRAARIRSPWSRRR